MLPNKRIPLCAWRPPNKLDAPLATKMSNNYLHWRIQGGARDGPRSNFFHFHAGFGKNLAK